MKRKALIAPLIWIAILTCAILCSCATTGQQPSYQDQKQTAYVALATWGTLGHNALLAYSDYSYWRNVPEIEQKRAMEAGQLFLNNFHLAVDRTAAWVDLGEGGGYGPIEVLIDEMAISASDMLTLVSGYLLDESLEAGTASPGMGTTRLIILGCRLGLRFGIPAVNAVWQSALKKDPTGDDFRALHDYAGRDASQYFRGLVVVPTGPSS